jgi:hypothetical protein
MGILTFASGFKDEQDHCTTSDLRDHAKVIQTIRHILQNAMAASAWLNIFR